MELFRQCGIFYFSVRFWNRSDSVEFFVFLVDFGTVPTVWYFLFFFLAVRFWNCSDSVVFFVFLVDFGTVPTVWYFLFFC